MLEATYGVALAAGVLAAVNPCGFALLPAYVSLLVSAESGAPGGPAAGRLGAVGRALLLTGAMTLGFAAVFGGFGLLAAPAADTLARQLPWLTIVLGLAVVGLGGWLLAGRSLPSFGLKAVRGPAVTRRFSSMVGFGAAYAVASLGCTIGPFLAVVVVAGFRQNSLAVGVAHFLAYAAGMALVVGSVALAVALARASLVTAMRRASPWLTRGGGGLLVLAGGYVAWYGGYELRVFSGGSADDPVVAGAERLQGLLEGWLAALGPGGMAVGFAVVLAVTLGTGWLARRRRSRGDPAAGGAPAASSEEAAASSEGTAASSEEAAVNSATAGAAPSADNTA